MNMKCIQFTLAGLRRRRKMRLSGHSVELGKLATKCSGGIGHLKSCKFTFALVNCIAICAMYIVNLVAN